MADWESMGSVITETGSQDFQTIGRVFDYILRLGRPCLKVLGRVFHSREFMKIWSVKSTVYSLESSVINIFNLHFINNNFSYSLRH